MTILLTLEIEGVNLGPFNLYSNTDGYTSPFATNITKDALEAGYTFTNVPPNTTIVQVKSVGNCSNSIDVILENTTTTSTSSTSSTTTTTTTINYNSYNYQGQSNDCDTCVNIEGFSIGNTEPLTVGKWYIWTNSITNISRKIQIVTYLGPSLSTPNTIILDSTKQDTCSELPPCPNTTTTSSSTSTSTSTTTSTTTSSIVSCTSPCVFAPATATFPDCIFPATATSNNCTFTATATFPDYAFTGTLDCIFTAIAKTPDCIFTSNATFPDCTFTATATFINCI